MSAERNVLVLAAVVHSLDAESLFFKWFFGSIYAITCLPGTRLSLWSLPRENHLPLTTAAWSFLLCMHSVECMECMHNFLFSRRSHVRHAHSCQHPPPTSCLSGSNSATSYPGVHQGSTTKAADAGIDQRSRTKWCMEVCHKGVHVRSELWNWLRTKEFFALLPQLADLSQVCLKCLTAQCEVPSRGVGPWHEEVVVVEDEVEYVLLRRWSVAEHVERKQPAAGQLTRSSAGRRSRVGSGSRCASSYTFGHSWKRSRLREKRIQYPPFSLRLSLGLGTTLAGYEIGAGGVSNRVHLDGGSGEARGLGAVEARGPGAGHDFGLRRDLVLFVFKRAT